MASTPNPTPPTAPRLKTFASVVAPATKGPSSKAYRRPATVTGSTGTYVGPKTDKHLKVQVDEKFTQDEVRQAVMTATDSPTEKIVVETLTRSAKNYAMSYRVKVQELRADHAANLLRTELWPSGMVVSNWSGPWQPLKQKSSLKIFVGNLHESAHPATIVDRIKSIYEAAGVGIATASSEKFVGKKTSTRQNLVVTVQSTNPGITLEPIQQAKLQGKVPQGIFIRLYGEPQKNVGQTWE